MSQSFSTIDLTVICGKNGQYLSNFQVKSTVLAPFWSGSATVLSVYNVVVTLHTRSCVVQSVSICYTMRIYTKTCTYRV